MHVHGVDAEVAQLVRVTFEWSPDLVPPLGVDEARPRLRAPRAEETDVGSADPELLDRTPTRTLRDREHRFDDRVVLHVDREVERSPELGVDVGEARDPEAGELVGRRGRHLPASQAPADRAVVDEDDLTVA